MAATAAAVPPQSTAPFFKETQFKYTRPDDQHMGKRGNASLKQAVFVWLVEKTLPLCDAGISFKDAIALWRRKIKGPAMLVATEADVGGLPSELQSSCVPSERTAELKVPWCDTPTTYRFYTVQPLRSPRPGRTTSPLCRPSTGP